MGAGGSSVSAREFPFTSSDFERIRTLAYQNVGISLSTSKDELVYSRVSRRLRATGHTSFASYLDALRPDSSEFEQFVNVLTTNLTAFFREAHHFTRLAQLLPTMPQPITIWCAACSTGEEPYSIAMTAAETFDTLTPPVRIIASDVDTAVIASARNGVYTEERCASLGAARMQRFFLRGKGDRAGQVRVRPELQKLISFGQINLLDPQWPIDGPLGAIFCRNVMIYFDRETQQRLLTRFVPLLDAQGLLFLGHSESIQPGTQPLDNLGQTVYARSATGASAANTRSRSLRGAA